MQDLSNLPFGSTYDPPERIVCAANKYIDGDVYFNILGIRHGCKNMNEQYEVFNAIDPNGNYFESLDEVQGFITNKGTFVNRQEAWKIAVEQHQIVRRVGGDTANGGILYSENLY